MEIIEDFVTQITKIIYEPVYEPSIMEKIFNGILNLLTAKRSTVYQTVSHAATGINHDQGIFLRIPTYIISNFTQVIRGITFSDVLTFTFFTFGAYVALQYFRKDGPTDFRYEVIPSANIHEHIKNVSTMIDKMHETHAQISERMCELQVPLTMVKCRTKVMDEKLNKKFSNEKQAGGDSNIPDDFENETIQ
ncbi:uncharacterized protein LOC123298631 [Chrysoperla carnea]|uniref:uncharacterized protein LOC123298631 n=1 Tax=Chrysoperla carnea TaxID=189513 RepID=UPI001D074C61|nr:uncharacterized protein LOC123298631 [Chrysoperla carnea]